MTQMLSLPRRLCAVFGGGFCGTLTRYWLSLLVQHILGKGWPADILLINLTGAFLLALITTLADAALWIGPTRRLFLGVGFLGAYTTFSSLALGDLQLLFAGNWLPALTYLLLSWLVGLLAVAGGMTLGRRLVAWKHSLDPAEVFVAPPRTSVNEQNLAGMSEGYFPPSSEDDEYDVRGTR
jgi:protein CrcB